MKIKFTSQSLIIQREEGDRPAKASGFTRNEHGWGAEIHLLYLIQQKLNKAGFNVCKVKTQTDGHMFGDRYMCYLRTPRQALRKRDVSYPYIYIVDGNYAIRSSAEEYNKGDKVEFALHTNVFSSDYPQPDCGNKIIELCSAAGFECRIPTVTFV